MEFGCYARQLRQQRHGVNRRYSIRQLAQRIGVEPTYLSKIERGDVDPPEHMIERLAAELGEDADVLLAQAAKVASDIREIITRRPVLFAELIRGLDELNDEELRELVAKVRNREFCSLLVTGFEAASFMDSNQIEQLPPAIATRSYENVI